MDFVYNPFVLCYRTVKTKKKPPKSEKSDKKANKKPKQIDEPKDSSSKKPQNGYKTITLKLPAIFDVS